MTSSDNRSISIDRNAIGCTIISGDGNQVVIYQNQTEQQTITSQDTSNLTQRLGSNPYRGLLPFQETNAAQYFGREQQITKLWESLQNIVQNSQNSNFLPIYGPSGSGKSSLARAGLLPRLAQNPFLGFNKLQVAVFIPSSHPLDALGLVLAKAVTQDIAPVAKTREFQQELRQVNAQGDYDGLRRIASVLPNINQAPLLILVDQFEEIYSLCESIEERNIFIRNLLNAAGDRSRQVMVLITLRSDFLGNIQKQPQLNQIFSRQGFLVPAMSEEELREAICKPALKSGYPFDEATVSLLLEQTKDRAGSLPLLQFTLTKIWEGLEKGKPPAEILENLKGVGGALAGEAQRVFDNLTEKQQKIARRIFLGLIQFGVGDQMTRRRVVIEQLRSYKDDENDFRTVLDSFAFKGVRLITLSGEGQETTVEVTHEALFQNWQKIKDWVEEDQSNLLFQRRVQEEAERWQQMGRPSGSLWRSPDLDLLERFYQQAGENMTPLQIDFLKACRLSSLIRTLVIGGLSIAVVSLGIVAYINKLVAEFTTIKALNQTAETYLASEQPFDALIAATKAGRVLLKTHLRFLNLPMSYQTKALLNQNLWQMNRLDGHTNEVWQIKYSPNGKLLASAGRDGKIYIWDAISGEYKFTLTGHDDSIREIVFSQESNLLISRSDDGMIKLWNLEKGEIIEHPLNNEKEINTFALSSQFSIVATGQTEGKVKLWNLAQADSATLLPLKASQNSIEFVQFTPDETKLIIVENKNNIYIWDMNQKNIDSIPSTDQCPFEEIQVKNNILAAAKINGTVQTWGFNLKPIQSWTLYKNNNCDLEEDKTKTLQLSPNGKILAIADKGEVINLWDLETKKEISRLEEDNSNNMIWDLEFSPNGQILATAGNDKKIRLWDWQKRQKQPFSILLGHTNAIGSLQFHPDGTMLASGSDDRTVRLWTTQKPLIPILQGHNGIVWDVSFNSDTNLITSVGEDSTVRFWDLEKKQQLDTIRLANNQNFNILSVALSHDKKQIAVGGVLEQSRSELVEKSGRIQLIRIDNFKNNKILDTERPVTSLKFNDDDTLLISGESDELEGTLRFWNLSTDNPVSLADKVPNDLGGIYAIEFKPKQSNILAFAGSQGIINFGDIRTKQSLKQLKAQVGNIYALKYSPDGTILASGGDTIRLWNSLTFEPITTLNGHINDINTLNFNTNGEILASASGDGTIKLWNIPKQQFLASLKGHYQQINDIEFINQDHSVIASASNDGSIILWNWDADLDKLVNRSCRWLENYFKHNQHLSDDTTAVCDRG